MVRWGALLAALVVLVPASTASARPALRRLPARPAFAARDAASVHQTFVVDTASDPSTGTSCAAGHDTGTCSLRAAIAAAETDSGHLDEVLIPNGTHVALSQGTLDLTHSMVIDGSGASVNGGGSEVFDIDDHPSVQISGLKITGGLRASGDGGAIYCNTGSLVLAGVGITGNTAQAGGGVYSNNDCQLWMDNSTVTGNQAPGGSGGGLYIDGSAYIERSTIGGTTSGTANVADQGAGIYSNGNVNVVNSTIEGNSSNTDYGKGVGIYNNGLLTVSGSTIALNAAPNGGEGAGLYNSNNAQIVGGSISANTISEPAGTSSTSEGAGVYGAGNQLSLTDVAIKGNSASSAGGGSVYGTAVAADDAQDSLNGVLISATTSGTSAAGDLIEGGAVFLAGQHASLNGVTISGTHNVAGSTEGIEGGAIYSSDSTTSGSTELRGLSISSTTNTAGYVEGGAIYNNGYSTMAGDDISSTSNPVTGSPGYVDGGAIYNNGNHLSISGTSIESTSDTAALRSGSSGATYIYGGELYNKYDAAIDGLSMTKLTATASGGSGYVYGGGIYNDDYLSAQDLQLVGATVNADAYLYGGLLYNDDDLNATNLTLGNATVSLDGTNTPYADGTILYDSQTNSSIVNGTFDGVSSTVPSGGSYLHAIEETGQLQLTNTTIAGDSLSGPSGSTFLLWSGASGSVISLRNSIVAGSTPALNCGTGSGGTISSAGYNLDNEESCPFFNTGDVQDGSPKVQPLANNGGNVETAALTAGSPAINSASNNGCPPNDARGVKRPFGSSCDMGAYEATSPFVTTGVATKVKSTAAVVLGSVNPDDQATRYYVQYGTSKSYGKKTSTLTLSGGFATHVVMQAISGLKHATTYHFRLVAISGVGASYGADRTFKTAG